MLVASDSARVQQADLANVSEEGLIADAGMGTVGVEVTKSDESPRNRLYCGGCSWGQYGVHTTE